MPHSGRSLLDGTPLSTYATAVVLHADAIVRVLVGDPHGPEARARPRTICWTPVELSGREYVALPLIWIEDYELATDAGRLAARRGTAAPATYARSRPRSRSTPTLRYRTGDWRGSRAAAAESVRLSRDSQQFVQLAYSLATLSIVQAGQDHPDALTTADEAQVLADEHGLAELEQYVAAARGLVELGHERPETALADLERAERYAAARPGRESRPFTNGRPTSSRPPILLGQHDRAKAVTTRLEMAAATTSRPWPHAVAARARGMLAPDVGTRRHLDEALGWHGRTVAPFERGRTHLWWGRRLRRDRRRVDARRAPRRRRWASSRRLVRRRGSA